MIYEDMLVDKIDSFNGENRFLSNFYPTNFYWMDKNWCTVEHAYQAAKTDSEEDFLKIFNAPTPGIAKSLGRKIKICKDWEKNKIQYMRKFVTLKFSNQDLKDKLITTYPKILIEGNTWGDIFWGVCDNKGQNILGKILMSIRNEELSRLGIIG